MNGAGPAEHRWPRLLTGEITLALIALALFAVFIAGLLRWYFPEGTEIGLYEESRAVLSTTYRAPEPALILARSPGARLRIGELWLSRNHVQSRTAGRLEWRSASIGAEFYDRDALQTGARAYAAVRADDGLQLRLGERSLVLFEGAPAGLGASQVRPSAIVVQGELRGQMDAGFSQRDPVASVHGGALRVTPTRDAATEYNVRVNDDQSATIDVVGGRAEYRTASGTVEFGPRQALTVNERGEFVSIVDMPEAPALGAPAARSRIVARGGPGTVDFSWDAVPGVDGYRFIVARDPMLTDRLVDERVPGTEFHHGGLRAGRYYWAVRARTGWVEGMSSEIRELVLVVDARPPELHLDATPTVVSVRTTTISGQTDPDARVFVAGKPAGNEQGRFSYATQLAAGVNIIVVESVDQAGNIAYASVVILAK